MPTPNAAPIAITRGPDGNLWFTENVVDRIGKITPSGRITEYRLPRRHSGPYKITQGPDGNLWFTEYFGRRIGRITPGGKITEYALPPPITTFPGSITPGPDGNLWFTVATRNGSAALGRITPSGHVSTYSLRGIAEAPYAVTTGPNRTLWFTEYDVDRVGRLTMQGDVRDFALPSRRNRPPYVIGSPTAITAGADGNLWFVFSRAGPAIGRITPGGHVSVLPSFQLAAAEDITLGPDKNIWVACVGGIVRVTPTGTITRFNLPDSSEDVTSLTAGPDGNLWFVVPQTESGHGNSIGRLSLASTSGNG